MTVQPHSSIENVLPYMKNIRGAYFEVATEMKWSKARTLRAGPRLTWVNSRYYIDSSLVDETTDIWQRMPTDV